MFSAICPQCNNINIMLERCLKELSLEGETEVICMQCNLKFPVTKEDAKNGKSQSYSMRGQ